MVGYSLNCGLILIDIDLMSKDIFLLSREWWVFLFLLQPQLTLSKFNYLKEISTIGHYFFLGRRWYHRNFWALLRVFLLQVAELSLKTLLFPAEWNIPSHSSKDFETPIFGHFGDLYWTPWSLDLTKPDFFL